GRSQEEPERIVEWPAGSGMASREGHRGCRAPRRRDGDCAVRVVALPRRRHTPRVERSGPAVESQQGTRRTQLQPCPGFSPPGGRWGIGERARASGNEAGRVRVTQDRVLKSLIRAEQGATAQFTHSVRPGAYYYLHVRETNGQDADGNEADAWTAPIWFTREV